MTVLIIRAAYVDTPEQVVECNDRNDAYRIIEKLYPGAVFDGSGGFDHESAPAGYLFDVCGVKPRP